MKQVGGSAFGESAKRSFGHAVLLGIIWRRMLQINVLVLGEIFEFGTVELSSVVQSERSDWVVVALRYASEFFDRGHSFRFLAKVERVAPARLGVGGLSDVFEMCHRVCEGALDIEMPYSVVAIQRSRRVRRKW